MPPTPPRRCLVCGYGNLRPDGSCFYCWIQAHAPLPEGQPVIFHADALDFQFAEKLKEQGQHGAQ